MAFKKDESIGTFCPMIRRTCIESKCALWTKVSGKNPQSEETIDHWGCAFAWLPVLLVENAQMIRQSGAATESMRNEIVKRMDEPKVFPRVAGNGREAIPRV